MSEELTQEEARAAGMHGWQMAICDNGLHVLPLGDTKDHMDEDCPCGAARGEFGVWYHNSFDGREAFEEGERKMS